MQITFFSNYFNHHQKALCDELFRQSGGNFIFVETEPMEEFRAGMGWEITEFPSYVLRSYLGEAEEREACRLGNESDVVMIGSAPERFVEQRIAENRLTFRYTERPLKEGTVKMFIPRLAKKFYYLHYRNRKKNIYVLGASAYAAADYKKLHSYPGKCLKFGYFPFINSPDAEELMRRKRKNSPIKILWTGRFLKLKRADLLLKACGMLRRRDIPFCLTIIGSGEEEAMLKTIAQKEGLEGQITWKGFLSPAEVRHEMEDANIYVMTSNFLEGWGSVIYEGLSAGCAVVASHACGSAPWLVRPGENGFLFENGKADSLYDKLYRLCTDAELTEQLGRNAYRQMQELWNPSVAAKRVIELSEALLDNRKTEYADGPLSPAPVLKNNWYKEG